MDNPQASKEEIAWLAALWLGEGSLIFHFNQSPYHTYKYRIKLEWQIVNTDIAIIVRCNSILRKIGINPYWHVQKANKGTKNIYQLKFGYFAKIKKVLTALLPYLVGRKEYLARLAIDLINSRIEKLKKDPSACYSDEELNIVLKAATPRTARKVMKRIEEYKKIRDKKYVPLNERPRDSQGNFVAIATKKVESTS